ncbi:MAG: MogA/MoaB family molybdenum cofactor biosynthesis protein [Acidimicrobiia bacterium]|nr:MogA/MoaB family molybdenum cofactor biosynthesis protein [Acidimicrobiia bacterium]NNC43518.1 MogA/MoaB family molybdenum cofactor biosynthesis protein [Acidimicrobiia bacterium]NNL28415.1 MogA/MoaB family molybdenum cofactor biosynthesis protein [Acidimicrobiia bacterium]
MTLSARTAAVLVASDGVVAGTRQDKSGDIAEQKLTDAGFDVVSRLVVPDETDVIEKAIEGLVDEVRVIITSGGTGFGPRDVTPEATLRVIDKRAEGLEHLMRIAGLEATKTAALSRAVAGSVGSTLIINTPGSSRAVSESLDSVMDLIPHILDLLEGNTGH